MPKNPNVEGMVLAAGFGSRLQPLTANTPKPMLPFFGEPILYRSLWRFAQADIQRVFVNAHYLWKQIEEAAQNCPLDLKIELSLEKEKLLGTGGAFGPIKKLIQGDHLLVINGDIVTNIDFKKLIEFHISKNSFATMVVCPSPPDGDKGIYCDGDFRILGFGKEEKPNFKRLGYASVQILKKEALEYFPEDDYGSLLTGYEAFLKEKKPLFALFHNDYWHAMDTPLLYWKAHRDYLDKLGSSPLDDPLGILSHAFKKRLRFIGKDQNHTVIQPTLSVSGPSLVSEDIASPSSGVIGAYSFVDSHASIQGGAKIEESLILEHSKITKSEEGHHLIVTSDYRLQV